MFGAGKYWNCSVCDSPGAIFPSDPRCDCDFARSEFLNRYPNISRLLNSSASPFPDPDNSSLFLYWDASSMAPAGNGLVWQCELCPHTGTLNTT